ncbi:MAG: hypothetical protein LAT66_09470 [Alkalimonas sp.]|nr:hypothetical protein [Alkalimonas sp.]
MTVKEITAAESELLYLKHNAVLCLIVGMVISGDLFYALLKSFPVAGWITSTVVALYAVTILVMLIKLFKVIRYSRGSTKKAFWYGDFKDEFSAFLNHRGYKYSFNTLVVILLATWILGGRGYFSSWLSGIELKDYAVVLTSIGMWSYALPVFIGLRADNE